MQRPHGLRHKHGVQAHELYERHAQAVYRYLARRAGTSVAEDLLGDVFVAALSARTSEISHDSGSALPWLYGIARNVLRNNWRRRQPIVLYDDVSTVDWDAVDTRLDAQHLAEPLRRALATLTDDERELLLLVAWEGLGPTEAAAALGLPPGTARSRLHRARLHAQHELDGVAVPDTSRSHR